MPTETNTNLNLLMVLLQNESPRKAPLYLLFARTFGGACRCTSTSVHATACHDAGHLHQSRFCAHLLRKYRTLTTTADAACGLVMGMQPPLQTPALPSSCCLTQYLQVLPGKPNLCLWQGGARPHGDNGLPVRTCKLRSLCWWDLRVQTQCYRCGPCHPHSSCPPP